MRILANIPNTKPVDAAYPKGNIRNKDTGALPPEAGTPVIEEVYGDMIQLFQKLVGLYGIVENDLPDNETNGYQLKDALDAYINDKAVTNPAWIDAEGLLDPGWLVQGGAFNQLLYFKQKDGTVHFFGKGVYYPAGRAAYAALVMIQNFPAGYRPINGASFVVNMTKTDDNTTTLHNLRYVDVGTVHNWEFNPGAAGLTASGSLSYEIMWYITYKAES